MLEANVMPRQPSTGYESAPAEDDEHPCLTIGVLTRDDAHAAASLHKRNFPDDLFTLTGERVLVRLFQEFANEVSLAAKLDGQLLGYSVGTLNKSHLTRSMVRSHMLILAAGIAQAILHRAHDAPGYIRASFDG